jgi:hypothetical protein
VGGGDKLVEDDVVAVDGRWMVIIVDGLKRVDPLLAYFKQPQYEIVVSTQSYSDPENTTLYTIKQRRREGRREKTRG